MLILLTNDDGINAPGIRALVDVFASDHEVVVVAPRTEQSGAAMSLTFRRPVNVREVDYPGAVKAFDVDGTPVDCVKLASHELMDQMPDLMISGINSGVNIGINALYSGTVAALLEGVFQGFRGMAVSAPRTGGPGYEFAARTAKYLFSKLYEQSPFGPLALSVNFPHRSPGDVKGIRLAAQCAGGIEEHYTSGKAADGTTDYTLVGRVQCTGDSEILDTSCIEQGYVSITPVSPNLTVPGILKDLGRADFSDFPR